MLGSRVDVGIGPINKRRPIKYLRVFTNRLVFHSVTWWLSALLLVGVMPSLPPVQTALGAARKVPLAYVTQRDAQPDAGAVAVIDTTTSEVVATVEVGPGPSGMAITSNGKWGYVANHGTFSALEVASLSNTVSVLKFATPRDDGNDAEDDDDAEGDWRERRFSGRRNARRPSVMATVEVGRGPLGVAIRPDRKEVYVTNFGTDRPALGEVGNTISVIRTASNKVIATITVGKLPSGIAFTPDGSRAYVTNRGDDTVSVIDTRIRTELTTVPVQYKPANVAITPDGRHAYVTNFGDPFPSLGTTVSVIDTTTNTVVATIPNVGLGPLGLAVTPDGAHVYVVNVISNNVSVIETATNTVVARVAVGLGPRAVAITRDGAHAYVTNFNNNTVSVIETATNRVVDTVPVAGGPNWVTIPGRHGKAHKGRHGKAHKDDD
jgi:YVTN family beta-propeller protein